MSLTRKEKNTEHLQLNIELRNLHSCFYAYNSFICKTFVCMKRLIFHVGDQGSIIELIPRFMNHQPSFMAHKLLDPIPDHLHCPGMVHDQQLGSRQQQAHGRGDLPMCHAQLLSTPHRAILLWRQSLLAP